MSLSTIILFSIAWGAVSIIPGPSMMLTLANGLTRNKRIITMGILGINTATLMLIGAVAVEGLAP